MEASDNFQGGCNRVGIPRFPVEKQGKGGGDNFIVEDLLDLSNEEDNPHGMITGVDGGSDAAVGFSSTDDSTVTAIESCSNCVSGGPDSYFSGELDCRNLTDAGLSGDLCEPYDELAELEWLSNFVEESFSSEDLQKLHLISGPKLSSLSASHGFDSTSQVPQPPFFCPEAPVPAKARSKRSRVAPCNWSSRLLLLSSSPTTSSSDHKASLLHRSTGKKASKEDPFPPSADGRKCLHCGTDKTPQWRTGPMGPKTLCNACGVRYKSGRLVPEYRPAASPTFVLSKHSNSHRKVLELRRLKEMQQQKILHGRSGAAAFLDEAAAVSGDDFLIHHHLGPDFRQLI